MSDILFVCTGNICRSPIAEGLFRLHAARVGLGPGWRVDSAGVGARDGLEPAPFAIEVAAEFCVDISAQRSRPFVAQDFQRFSYIVAMDYGHLDWLLAMRPSGHSGYLGIMHRADGAVIDVDDPYGRPRRAYVRAAQEIDEGVALIAEQLLAHDRL